MKNLYTLFRSIIILFLISSFSFLSAQLSGEYRSSKSGNWGDNIWQIFNGSNWVDTTTIPGVPPPTNATYKVTISAGTTVTIPSTYNVSTLYFGDLLIDGDVATSLSGQLIVQKSMTFPNTKNLIIDYGILNLNANPLDFKLPVDAQVYILNTSGTCSNNSANGINGIGIVGGTCNNNVNIYIGSVLYAVCAGQGNPKPAGGTFCDMNTAGGTLKSIPIANPSDYCGSLPRTGGFALSQTTGINQGVTGLQYSWSLVSAPAGYSFTTTAFNSSSSLPLTSTATNPTIPGVYTFKLTVRKQVTISGSTFNLYAYGTVNLNLNVNVKTGAINNLSLCSEFGSTPNTLNFTAYTGTIVEWEESTTSNFAPGTVTTIANTSPNYTVPFSNVPDRYYRVRLTNGTCSFLSPVAYVGLSATSYDGTFWTNGLPDSTKKWVFNFPYTVTTNETACSVLVQNSSNVVISGGVTSINEVVVDANSQLTVNNDANLVQVNDNATNSGNITVKRNIKFKSPARDQYNYLISPVVGQSLKTIYPGVPTTAVYPYVLYHNETNNRFYNSTGAYIKGRGLAVKEPSSTHIAATSVDAEFKGLPVNGVVTYALAYTDAAHGFNLVGNPYPSNIDLRLLYLLNGGTIDPQSPSTTATISSSFYFWDNAANDISVQQGDIYNGRAYAVYNAYSNIGNEAGYLLSPSQVIGAKKPNNIAKIGQGFMVRSTGPSKVLTYNNSVRTSVNTGASFFSKMSSVADRYWLTLQTPNKFVNSIAITYFDGGINGFGIDDSEHNVNASDLLYSISDNHKLQIEGKPNFVDTDKIYLGTKHFTDGNYKFSLEQKEGVFSNGQSIYLKDNQTGIITDLTKGNYEYLATKGETSDRFEIIYSTQTTLLTNDVNKDELQVYRDVDGFVIKSRSKNITKVEVYDASGRLVYQKKTNDKNIFLDFTKIINGLYILKINQGDTETVKKIVK